MQKANARESDFVPKVFRTQDFKEAEDAAAANLCFLQKHTHTHTPQFHQQNRLNKHKEGKMDCN